MTRDETNTLVELFSDLFVGSCDLKPNLSISNGSKHHFRIFLLRAYRCIRYNITQFSDNNDVPFWDPWTIMDPAEARRISFRFFCTTSTRAKPPSSKRSGIRASMAMDQRPALASVFTTLWVYHGTPKSDGLSRFIIIFTYFHHERTHFHLDHLRYAQFKDRPLPLVAFLCALQVLGRAWRSAQLDIGA